MTRAAYTKEGEIFHVIQKDKVITQLARSHLPPDSILLRFVVIMDFIFNVLSRVVYIVCPSVLSCSNVKLHQTLEVKNTFQQEKIDIYITMKVFFV